MFVCLCSRRWRCSVQTENPLWHLAPCLSWIRGPIDRWSSSLQTWTGRENRPVSFKGGRRGNKCVELPSEGLIRKPLLLFLQLLTIKPFILCEISMHLWIVIYPQPFLCWTCQHSQRFFYVRAGLYCFNVWFKRKMHVCLFFITLLKNIDNLQSYAYIYL